jgi:filamentous hemagglutinin
MLAALRASRHTRATAGYCSLLVFAGLGLLGAGSAALAQAAGAALPPNTLPVLRGVVAGQAVVNAPVRGATPSQMTIDQASRRAIIDWRSFNIGSDAEVLFRHEQGSAASTLNRIYDANPSVIQGRLTSVGPVGADKLPTPGGQVLLINQNGILFDRGSQVNTQSLLASTLNLSMSNLQFCGGDLLACNTGAALTFGGLSTPAFEGGYDELGNTLPNRLGGQRAGTIGIGSFGPSAAAAPVIKAGAGGSIVLIASRIDHNAGLIASPDGQVVLAAGNKAYLGLSEDSADITLRGFRVEVEAAKDGPDLNLTNLVRNAGEITADRGNVTLAALAINQEGRISAKTAVQRNGSIYLTARTRGGADAGTLHLAAGSVTEVVPDAADKATLPDSVAYAPYRGVIRAEAGLIESHGTLQAQGGRIGLEAANAADPTAARVYLGDGSLTSVAGAWADVDAGKNLATFRVTSNELKNSPDQKGGLLLGATVTVDLRDGNNLLALEGYRDAVSRTVVEKAAVGGELSIGSTGSVIQRDQATIDASGGGYRHAGGLVATSKLVGDDGRIYDIGTAPQQRQYVAQLDRYQTTDARWGVTTSITNLAGAAGTFREAYVEGLSGGSVRIGSGAGLVVDGALKGGVTIGPRQLARAPQGATLLVGTGLQPLSLGSIDRPPVAVVYNNENQRIGNVLWRQQATDSLGGSFSAATPLTGAQIENFALGANQVFGAATQTAQGRVEVGFGSVEVNSDGRITLPADVSIRSDIGANLTLRGPALDIAGDVRLPSGTLTLAPQLFQTEPYDAALLTLNERTLVRETATLSVAGAWLNQSGLGGAAIGAQLPSGRLTASGSVQSATNGGSLTLRVADADFQTRLERGAVLDVSGGALLDSSRRVTGGRGGQLSLANGIANQLSSDWQQAELRGHAVGTGGSLTLNLARAEIAPAEAEGVLPSATTRLGADLFAEKGFSSIAVNAPNGVVVTPGTQVTVRQRNLQVDLDAALALPSGGDLQSVATVQTLPEHLRAPASLSLSSDAGAARVSAGASVVTDAGGSVSLVGGSGLTVDGQLVAPGGRITLTLRGSDLLDATPLRLGSQSMISTAGTFVPTPSDAGLVRGNVLGGGTVTLDARQAGISAAAGSRIDVSGLERRVDIVSESGGAVQQQVVAGHAGTLIIKAQDAVSLGGTLAAVGPGTAAGGSFAMELTRADRQTVQPAPQRLVVSASGVDQAVNAGTTTTVLDANALQTAGFEKLRLLSEDHIEFQGSAVLDFERGIRLDAPVVDLRGTADARLRASTVSIGQSLGARVQRSDEGGRLVWTRDDTLPQPDRLPQAGAGLLTLDAGLVDFYGSLTLQGTALTRVNSVGDVRFIGREANFNPAQGNDARLIYQYGSLDAAGKLEFNAAQLYPVTRSRFEVQAHGQDAALQIKGNSSKPGDVFSVAGALTLRAPTLMQAGTVRAPQGELSLVASERLELAPGSVTSVSGNGLTVLYGGTLDGVQWRYIDGNQTSSASNPRLLDAVSEAGKRLTLSAPAIVVESGATVDLRGGGNVLATEFVAGNGGDNDVTNAANTFAILPKSNLASIPYDTYLQFAAGARDPGAGFSLANGRDTGLYDSVQIGAGSRVPAGEYVLLPANFALLPDAYLVQLQTGSAFRNLQPGQAAFLANGERVVAGHRSARDTAVRESQSVGVVVLPGSAVNRYSDYTLSGAQLFADEAVRLGRLQPSAPWDAGAMGILNANALSLGASFLTDAVEQGRYKGRGAEIDISGPRIAIVDRVGSPGLPTGTLEIASATLSGLDASVLVGGTRTRSNEGVRISTSAQQVTVANSAQAPVELPELLISARDRIDVAAGSTLRATGNAGSDAQSVLSVEASGALLRLSGGAQATVDRGAGAGSAAGDIDIAAGATLQSSGSLLLDATRTTRSLGQLRAGAADGSGGAISLAASTLSLGQVSGLSPTGLAGLVLSNDDLAAYSRLDALTLRAYDRIDFLGNATVGSTELDRLTLDSPLLSSQAVNGISQATVKGAQVQWVNRSSSRRDASGGTGQLDITAQQLLLGQGEKASSGFGAVNLVATGSIEVQGEGDLRSGGALALGAPTVRVAGGADQRIAAVTTGTAAGLTYGRLQLSSAGSAPAAAATSAGVTALGGRLQLEGRDVDIDTRVQTRSGQLTVTAQGGDVHLGKQAVLDAAGDTKNFNGSVAAVDGGTVALRAAAGTVRTEAGSRIDVSAAALGGNAGVWQLTASSASLGGSVLGRAGASARAGAAEIDVATLQSFSELNSVLDVGGFTEERRVRLRDGDLRVAETDTVNARRVTLTTDSGRIDVAGTVGRNTAQGGGQVALSAADGLSLTASSRLLAAGTDTAARGGEVRVNTRGGSLEFARGAAIDVRAGKQRLPGLRGVRGGTRCQRCDGQHAARRSGAALQPCGPGRRARECRSRGHPGLRRRGGSRKLGRQPADGLGG